MRIVLLVGLPGSGKSTWARAHGAHPLSSDDLRQWLMDDATDQTIHFRVFLTIRYLLRHRLALGRPVTYIDATHLTPEERRPYFEIAAAFSAEVEAVYFEVPPAVCQTRNAARARVVPLEALQRMADKLRPPLMSEGFSRITVIAG